MCSHLLKKMENYQGELADIVRATASSTDGCSAAAIIPDWSFPSDMISDPAEDFGDPFTYMMRDPVMQNIDSPGLFYNSNIINGGVEENGSINLGHRVDDEKMKRPSSIFSRMLQISPNAKLTVSPAAAPPSRGLKVPPNTNRALVESPGLQMSSPRNTGIKRRKCQAKKVVCIPAPAPANSRSSGEVVPSDLWAWRKYGQKPIKGSPFPRGYYRCSSSKGCSARKQVERSRTDPNMLVITYTSEHNHPWPTQRNALAGSSRSQPCKNNTTSAATHELVNKKHEQTETAVTSCAVDENSAAVKEETDQDSNNRFRQTYKPTLPDSNHSEDSFFADLGEIEADPLNLLFTQGFSRADSGPENADLDPFTFYDWVTHNSNSTTAAAASSAASYGESNGNT